jgi:hypothetical protein
MVSQERIRLAMLTPPVDPVENSSQRMRRTAPGTQERSRPAMLTESADPVEDSSKRTMHLKKGGKGPKNLQTLTLSEALDVE